MTHNIDLILTLTGGLAAALVLGYITDRLKLSPIVGYLLAGIAVGPFTPGFVANESIAAQFAELGVILLMFGVGIHFNLKDLNAVRRVAIPGALVQSIVATILGAVVTRAFGWTLEAGLVFGVAISVASTVVLLRVLADNNELHTHAGHVAVGWLIVEDILTVIALVVLPLVVGPAAGAADGGLVWSLGKALLEIAFLCVFTLVVGMRVLPKLLGHIAKSQSRELFTLCVLVIALGIAVGAAKLFGASMALGAFLAGMVVGQSDVSARAAAEALPLRDAFAVLFFVAMGMLFDPAQVLDNLPLTLATLAVVMIGKPLAALAVVYILRQPVRTSAAVSVALAQVGEFSFMVASVGLALHVLPIEASQALVAVSIISITLNPLLFKLVDPLTKRLAAKKPQHVDIDAPMEPAPGHVIVVGYGPVGQQVVRLLVEHNVTPTILDLNLDVVQQLRREGMHAIYGDASMREILEAAGIHDARGLIFASNAPTFDTVSTVRELRDDIIILTRTTYLRDAEPLRRAGATVIISEAEVALAMTENVLVRLGATAEQLDRARARVRNDIDGGGGHGGEQGTAASPSNLPQLRSIHEPA